MNLEVVKQGATRTLGRAALTIQKYSPEILTGVGIAGLVGSAVMAGRASYRLPEIQNRAEEAKSDIQERAASNPTYAMHESGKDVKYVNARATKDIVLLYAPAVVLGAGGVVCILSGFGILKKRNAALAAAYVALAESYEAYRNRVKEKYGEEEERAIYLDVRDIEVTDEDGKPMALTTFSGSGNPYGRWFDEGSTQFSKEPGYNYKHLITEQNYLNELLKARGYVFLNEVYKRLGLPLSQEGQVVGWVYKKDEEVEGDAYIDFRIMNPDDPALRDFVNGWNKVVYLDFNVQGFILDKFKKD